MWHRIEDNALPFEICTIQRRTEGEYGGEDGCVIMCKHPDNALCTLIQSRLSLDYRNWHECHTQWITYRLELELGWRGGGVCADLQWCWWEILGLESIGLKPKSQCLYSAMGENSQRKVGACGEGCKIWVEFGCGSLLLPNTTLRRGRTQFPQCNFVLKTNRRK